VVWGPWPLGPPTAPLAAIASARTVRDFLRGHAT
jgi:hypothetical protein